MIFQDIHYSVGPGPEVLSRTDRFLMTFLGRSVGFRSEDRKEPGSIPDGRHTNLTG